MDKTKFLSRIATFFDLLGLLSPFLIRAKILMQEVWLNGLEWDEILSQELIVKVNTWFAELSIMSDIKLRCLLLKRGQMCSYMHL